MIIINRLNKTTFHHIHIHIVNTHPYIMLLGKEKYIKSRKKSLFSLFVHIKIFTFPKNVKKSISQ